MEAAKRQRVVVGLSGGVDSAVAAWLLKRAGHEVVAIFMKNWEDDDDDAYCSSRQDFVDAAAVADVLGIEIEHVNFAADYRDRVFAEFLREYEAGRQGCAGTRLQAAKPASPGHDMPSRMPAGRHRPPSRLGLEHRSVCTCERGRLHSTASQMQRNPAAKP